MINYFRARSLRKLAVGVVLAAVGCAAGKTGGAGSDAQGQRAIEEVGVATAKPSPSRPEHAKEQDKSKPATVQVSAPISISWRIPAQPVDGFILYYGPSPEKLDSQVRVSIEQLAPAKEQEGQQVYRYLLRGVSAGQRTIVAIASYRGNQLSPPSAPMEVTGDLMMRKDRETAVTDSEQTSTTSESVRPAKDPSATQEPTIAPSVATPSAPASPEPSPASDSQSNQEGEIIGS